MKFEFKKHCASWAVYIDGNQRASIYVAISGRYCIDLYVHPNLRGHLTSYDTLAEAKAAIKAAYSCEELNVVIENGADKTSKITNPEFTVIKL